MGTPVTVKIKFKSDSLDQFIAQYAADVSESGIFIRTPRPLAAGTNLTFHFQLQDGSPLLSGNGTVVWVREHGPDLGDLSPGMGVRFDSLPPEGQAIVARVVREKQEGAQFDEELPTRVAPDTMRKQQEREIAAASSPLGEDLEDLPLADTVAAPVIATSEPMREPTEPDTEENRRDRLERILFSEEAPQGDGAQPIEHEEPEGAGVRPGPAYAGAARSRRASTVGWFLLALLLTAGGAAYYYLVIQKPAEDLTSDGTQEPAPVGEDKPSGVATPEPSGMSLRVSSTPPGAKILLDGTDTGKVTPAELSNVSAAREVEISLDLPGKKLVKLTRKPSPGEPIEVTLSEPAKRTVRIASEPPGAVVLLDKRKIGQTPLEYSKPLNPERRYELTLQLRGHKPHTVTIMPSEATWEREGEDEVLEVTAALEELAAQKAKRPARAQPEPAQPKPAQPKLAPKPTPKPTEKPSPTEEQEAEPEPAAEDKPAEPPKPAAPPADKPRPKDEPAADDSAEPADKPAEGAVKKPAIKIPSWGE